MEDLAKTPKLHRREGVFYFRSRVPVEVSKAISGNPNEWRKRTTLRGAPIVAWMNLKGRNGQLKKELWRSLEARDLASAKRALAVQQVELDNLYAEIIAALANVNPHPTSLEVDRIALEWFSEFEKVRKAAAINFTRSANLQDNEDAHTTLREDLSNAQSHHPQDLATYDRIVDQLLVKKGFASNARSSEFLALRHLIQRGYVERARRDLDEFEGTFGKTHDEFFRALATIPNNQRKADVAGYTLEKLITDFKSERSPLISAKTIASYGIVYRVAEDLLGKSARVAAISREDCKNYIELLRQLPANYEKRRQLKGLNAVDAAKRAKQAGLEPMSVSTAKSYYSRFMALLNYAVDIDELSKNAGNKLSVGRFTLPPEDRRESFRLDELQKIFTSPAFREASTGRKTYRKPHRSQPDNLALFWATSIALFTGFRLGEILQMNVSDIEEREGITLFVVSMLDEKGNKSPHKRLKTNSSRRIVPVHPELLGLGFLDYLESLRLQAEVRLFPDIKAGSDTYLSSPFSKRFSYFLNKCGVKTKRNGFHSFRHTFRDAMREAGLDDQMTFALGGWSPRSVSDSYGSGMSPKSLHSAILKIRYEGLDFSNLYRNDPE